MQTLEDWVLHYKEVLKVDISEKRRKLIHVYARAHFIQMMSDLGFPDRLVWGVLNIDRTTYLYAVNSLHQYKKQKEFQEIHRKLNKEHIKAFTYKEVYNILNDLLRESREFYGVNGVRFNGINDEILKQVFYRHGVNYEKPF